MIFRIVQLYPNVIAKNRIKVDKANTAVILPVVIFSLSI